MILALAVVLGMAASLARFRRHTLDRIAAIPLRSAWLALAAVAMQWPLLRMPAGPGRHGVEQVLFILSHVLLLIFVWRNRRLAAIWIIGLGVICNLAVILANSGYMPITPETLVQINPGSTLAAWPVGAHYGGSKDLILPRPQTALWLLSDILVVPPPFPWPAAFSLGDLILAAGVIWLLCCPPGPEAVPPDRARATPASLISAGFPAAHNNEMKEEHS
jgi:hypothetical protein